MSFRTVIIKERSKLDLKTGYLVCRNSEEKKVFIPEISFLILESTAISLTSALISELVKNNVKIIFCDEKHSPESEITPYYGHFLTSKRIKAQTQWKNEIKGKVWAEIVKEKIKKQKEFLKAKDLEEWNLLESYQAQVEIFDNSNREGHAAKVYFNALWGRLFSRRDQSSINAALNYGYSILLSCFNREIVKLGYLTELGIWHKNEFNQFNLSCDFMEPFRVLIDKIVFDLTDEHNFKKEVLKVFEVQIKIDGKMQYLENAISIYCQSIFNAIENEDISLIKFYE